MNLNFPRVSHIFNMSKISVVLLGFFFLALIVLGIYWSSEPEQVKIENSGNEVTGVTSVNTLIKVSETLLDKPGGYLTNDVTPPSWWLDNMPNWEFGVLLTVRDYSRVLRNEISRSQSQSLEDPALEKAEPNFNIDSNSWIFPTSEGEYREGIEFLQDYRNRLSTGKQGDRAHFYANANNLVDWLSVVQQRIGSTIQRLGASTGKTVPSDLSTEPATAKGEGLPADEIRETTDNLSWFEVDDQFYHARGQAWALLAMFKATEVDFSSVLENKNATVQYRQIIRELEAANKPVTAWMITNGSGFGMFPNHCLVMAAYLGSANAAISNLINLLENG